MQVGYWRDHGTWGVDGETHLCVCVSMRKATRDKKIQGPATG